MIFNFIEICRTDDKYAAYYLNANKSNGLTILRYLTRYFTFVSTSNTWKSPTATFKSVESGTYVLRDNKFVKIS
jgi:hypothetical protein